jgi:hypothetical protein
MKLGKDKLNSCDISSLLEYHDSISTYVGESIMSKDEVVSSIGDVESGVKFLKDRIEETPDGYTLKKADAVAFMAASGVPEAAHKQVLNAEGLMLRSLYQMTGDKLMEKVNLAKKAGINVAEEPVTAETKVATLGGKHRFVATSTRMGISPKTGEKTQSYGRCRLISDLNRAIPKEERQSLVDNCKKACGVI